MRACLRARLIAATDPYVDSAWEVELEKCAFIARKAIRTLLHRWREQDIAHMKFLTNVANAFRAA
jgi:hypothetical protein